MKGFQSFLFRALREVTRYRHPVGGISPTCKRLQHIDRQSSFFTMLHFQMIPRTIVAVLTILALHICKIDAVRVNPSVGKLRLEPKSSKKIIHVGSTESNLNGNSAIKVPDASKLIKLVTQAQEP